jgi:hypothetical protein
MNKKNLLLPILALICLAWPIIVDQRDLGAWLNPSATTSGETLAWILKIISLIAGGMFAASFLLVDKKLKNWQLWSARMALAVLISGGVYIAIFVGDFARR